MSATAGQHVEVAGNTPLPVTGDGRLRTLVDVGIEKFKGATCELALERMNNLLSTK